MISSNNNKSITPSPTDPNRCLTHEGRRFLASEFNSGDEVNSGGEAYLRPLDVAQIRALIHQYKARRFFERRSQAQSLCQRPTQP